MDNIIYTLNEEQLPNFFDKHLKKFYILKTLDNVITLQLVTTTDEYIVIHKSKITDWYIMKINSIQTIPITYDKVESIILYLEDMMGEYNESLQRL